MLTVDIDYNNNSSLELFYDTGLDFNQAQSKRAIVQQGPNHLQIPFKLTEQQQLKFLRLDFGQDSKLTHVVINRLLLSSKERVLFDMDNETIAKRIGFSKGINQPDNKSATFQLKAVDNQFDPYLVFSPINELMCPKWKRTLLLIFPWLLFLFWPTFDWVKQRIDKRETALLLAGFFLVSIPLKAAWVSFASLLLLAYAYLQFAKNRRFVLNLNLAFVSCLFLVPFLFLGNGSVSKLSIPLGFIIFPVIFSLIDFSPHLKDIKEIFTKVFFVFMSILITSWILLVSFDGYFYDINLSNFFLDLKSNRHQLLYWIYYDHTTFLSFFILIGTLFARELFIEMQVSKIYILLYVLFTIISLLLLGSRFAMGVGVLLLVLSVLPRDYLKKLLLPFWILNFASIVFFIEKIDPFRAKLWETSWAKVNESFWLGHGTGNSSSLLPRSLPIQKLGVSTPMEINHSHNQFLTYFMENGFIGALLALVLLVLIFNQFIKQNNKTMMLVLFAFLMLMATESPFKTATPLYVISFLLSVFSRNSRINDSSESVRWSTGTD